MTNNDFLKKLNTRKTAEGIITDSMSSAVLDVLFWVYGSHDAGVELCDRAINGDVEAKPYAEKIWDFAENTRKGK